MAHNLDREPMTPMTIPVPEALRRLPFDEMMQLSRLPSENGSNTRYMSRYPAWKSMREYKGADLVNRLGGPGTFGGVVYGQAPLAAARDIEQSDGSEAASKEKLGIHSIQGTFTNPGLGERPFVFDILPVQTGRSFMTRIINARQPLQPSEARDGPFPLSDAEKPLGDICFTCITTFKRGRSSPDDIQASISGQQLYGDILSKRAPNEWDPCPQMDLDIVREALPIEGHGSFPILDMYKVDMTEFNEGKGLAERRELILYRPYQHIPKDDPNGHIVAHAFGADRNGLLMLSNQIGYGYRFGKAASLSYSFYVHVNPEEAVMDDEGWWLWEVQYPRVNAGRCMMLSRIWSPEGKHVASGYQDGLALPYEEGKSKSNSKL